MKVQVPAFRLAGLEIAAIWARDEEKAQKIAKENNIPLGTSDYSKILKIKEIDLVSILTPPFLHKDMTIDALNAGKHVLCDKPTALNTQEVQEMLEISKKYPNQLSIIDHEKRFLPSTTKMKEQIESGVIGNIIHMELTWKRYWDPYRPFDWWSDESKGGGILFAIGSHYIDLLTWLTGKKVKSVYGDMKNFVKQRKDVHGELHDVTADDYCSMDLKYEGDVPCNMIINSFVSTDHIGYNTVISIHGEKGSIHWNQGNLTVYSEQKKVFEYQEKYDVENKLTNAFLLGTYHLGVALKNHFEKGQDIRDISANFSSAIEVQKVLDSCKESSKKKKSIDL